VSEFQIRKENFATNRVVETATPAIGEGEILVKVDRFAFTANNITYAVLLCGASPMSSLQKRQTYPSVIGYSATSRLRSF
jgi:hypothetical protein